MISLDWNFLGLSTNKFTTNTHSLSVDFDDLKIDLSATDVEVIMTNEQTATVVCYEDEKEPHEVLVEEGVLIVRNKSNKKWYEYIGINFNSPKITIYLPTKQYGNIEVAGSSGDVIVKDLSAGSLKITLSTGDITLSGVNSEGDIIANLSTGNVEIADSSCRDFILTASTGHLIAERLVAANEISVKQSTGEVKITDSSCLKFSSSASTGDLVLERVVAASEIRVTRSTGDVSLNSCDSARIYVKTDTGDIKGKLLSKMNFVTQTDTGKISVPDEPSDKICELTTDTGDIIFK